MIILFLRKKNKLYKVKRGDTLYSISKKFNISIEVIIKTNNLQGKNLKVGQILKVKK